MSQHSPTTAPPSTEGQRLFDLQAQYIADLNPLPNLAHAAVVRSPYAHARIHRIDPSAALALPGVITVLTGREVQEWSRPFAVAAERPGRYYSCAIDKVRYVGEPVAVVVAANRYVAEDARDTIEVEYEPLPAVVEVEAAMQSSAPVLHEELGTNVAIDRQLTYGDVAAVFKAADIVFSQRYVFPRYQSFPLETYGIVASWNPSASQVSFWANFHGPYSMLAVLAGALRVPLSKLRVVTPPDVGGSFGNKIALYPYMALMALASRKAGRPVKWIEDRLESLSASSTGTDRVTQIEVAARNDGQLLGLKMRLIDNVGAYIRAPEPGCLFRPIGNFMNAYKIEHLEVNAVAVMTNVCPSGPNRGYACQQHYFPIERAIDELALKLGKDPATVRLQNLVQPQDIPYRTVTGGLYDSGDYPRATQRALELSNYWQLHQSTGAAGPSDAAVWRGVGMAVAIDPSGSNMGYIDVSKKATQRRPNLVRVGSAQTTRIYLDATGGVTVELETAAHGQGQETTAALIVAQTLGIAPADVTVIAGMDTGSRPWSVSSGSYSSRFGAVGASSIVAATRRLQENLLQAAAYFLDSDVSRLRIQAGRIVSLDNAQLGLSLKDVAARLHWSTGTLPPHLETATQVEGTFVASELDYPNEHDQVNSSAVYAFTADVAVVEIDKETLDIRVTDYITVHDAGNILHPQIARGQFVGGLLHGLAGALYEELRYSETGDFLTGTLMDYLCPTVSEMPDNIVTDHIVLPTPQALTGAKGVGESTAQTAPIAIANAVADAVRHLGLEITELPLTPDKLWQQLEARLEGEPACT